MFNQLTLSASVGELAALRYTPAGVPILMMKLLHQSQQQELGVMRQIACEIDAKLTGEMALAWQNSVGRSVIAKGFLAPRSMKNNRLVLHIQHIEMIKVNDNGS